MVLIDFPRSRLDQNVRAYPQGGKKRFERDATIKFRFWHVENLLNRASDLLDRCIAEQLRWDSLRAQAVVLNQAMRTEDELLRIEEEKVTAGFFDYPYTDAKSKWEMLTKISVPMGGDKQHGALGHIFQAANYARETYKDLYGCEVQLGAADQWMCSIERYLHETEEATKNLERAQGASGLVEIAKRQIAEARNRLKSKQDSSRDGGPLDFEWQAKRCAERANRDYSDALTRLVVASVGMKTIYNYEIPFGPVLDLIDKGIANTIDAATSWARDAIKWLAAFSQNDQTFTVKISLREALGERWKEITKPRAPLEFLVERELFKNHYFVRLRGLSASITLRSGSDAASIRCIINVPASAVIVVPDPIKEQELLEVPIDQRNMPACYLGNVVDYRVPMEPEVCGAISLLNASPIANPNESASWSIQVDPIEKGSLELLNDIQIQLKVSGQPEVAKRK